MNNKKGIDWSKKDMYEGIGRPDLKPIKEEVGEIILFEGELIKYPNICFPIYEIGGVEIKGETAQIFENLKRKGLEHKNIQIIARVIENETK